MLSILAATVVASINVGTQACGMTAAGQFMYADSYGRGSVSKIDPRTNKVVKTIAAGAQLCGMAAGGGALWVEDWGASRIVRINLKTFKVTHHIKVGRKPWDVAYGFGAAWASNQQSSTITRIDAKTLKTKTVDVGIAVTCIRPGAGALWIGSQTQSSIWRLDPKTLKGTEIKLTTAPQLCVDPNPDGVWVTNGDQTVSRIDPVTLAVTHTVPVGGNATDLVRGPDGLEWVAVNGAGTVVRIDPATAKVVDTITTGGKPFVIRSAFGSVWTADFSGSTLWRLQP